MSNSHFIASGKSSSCDVQFQKMCAITVFQQAASLKGSFLLADTAKVEPWRGLIARNAAHRPVLPS